MDIRVLVRIALFAAIIAALGLVPKIDLPFLPGVPITAQTLGVMLAGLLLGARQGALAVLLFLFIVALGAPLLAGGRGGLGVFFGPTAGFLLGFVPGAFVCGLLMRVMRDLPIAPSAMIAAVIGGIAVIYAIGIPVLAWKGHVSLALAFKGSMAFLPGDLIKAALAGLVTAAVHRAAPALITNNA